MPVIELQSMWHRLTFFGLLLVSTAYADELKQAEGVELVQAHCVACHSLKLVTQHRMSREGWLASIRYMQKNHNLWPLGDHEEPVLNYLATNYGPDSTSRKRRANLPYIAND